MDKLYSPAVIRKIMNKHAFSLSKSLGQNFLIDGNIVDSIIRGADIEEEDLVIEVGPGLGVLTSAAAKKGRMVIGIEIDKNLIPILRETLNEHDNVCIINDDFLKINLSELIQSAQRNKNDFKSVKFIGNLPYYITSAIIMKVLEERPASIPKVKSMTLMMQKEVGDRIKALPGGKEYGALSVAVQYYCEIKVVANVPRTVFIPKPKVDSVVLNLAVRERPPVELYDVATFFRIVKTAFGQRRKTLLNSLTGYEGMEKSKISALLEAAGIDSTRRPETLNLTEFATIANLIKEEKTVE